MTTHNNQDSAKIRSATFPADVKTPGYYRDHEVPNLVGEALRIIEASSAHWSTKAVLLTMAHTAARQKEIRDARWEEIDWTNATLNVPANRTKTGKPRVIPLSTAVVALLEEAHQRTGGVGLVFPSRTGQPISNAALSRFLKAHAGVFAPHALRSIFRIWAAEHGIPDRVAELTLGHPVPGIGAGVDLRRAVMEQWSQCLTNPPNPRRP